MRASLAFALGPALLLLMQHSSSGQPVRWEHLGGGRWKITHTATHPGPQAGTQITIEATAVYYDHNGQRVGEAVSDPLTLTVGETVWRKEWLYTLRPGLQAAITADSGTGGLEMDWPRFRVWVNVPNDGREHTFSWILSVAP